MIDGILIFGTVVFRSIDVEKQARADALGGETVELHPREFNLSVYLVTVGTRRTYIGLSYPHYRSIDEERLSSYILGNSTCLFIWLQVNR